MALRFSFWLKLSGCRLLGGTAACLLFFAAADGFSQTADVPPQAPRVLTNFFQMWELPHEQRLVLQPIKTEVVVYYFDSEWNNAWGECQGLPTWLPLGDIPNPNLRPGQRVAIDGVMDSIRERLVWDQTQVRILDEEVELPLKPAQNLRENAVELKSQRILVEGLIDHLMEDPTHVTMNFLGGGMSSTVFLLKGTTNGPSPEFKEGDFVRMKCVYAPQFDRDGNLAALNLWVANPKDVEVIGSLRTDSRFEIPLTPCDEIRSDSLTHVPVRVEGIVRSHEIGKWITIWDAAGQVLIQSSQTQPLRFGDRIEAIGYPEVLGVQQCLKDALYRFSTATNPIVFPGTDATDQSPLRLAEQVRDLDREAARMGLSANLRAVVTWSHSNSPFAFVQDASGGVRVWNPKWEPATAMKPGTIVSVRGEVCEGDFVPAITNAVLSRVGWWEHKEGRFVTLEQALTGVEVGHWIEMRGYVRSVTPVNALTRFDLSTSSGDFQAWIPASQPFEHLIGSIVRVRGVCSAICNARHQLIGVQVWLDSPAAIQVEEPAPDDPFTATLRPLDSLRRFNQQNALNRRVRISGTVVLHSLGRYLYVQDGVDSVFALSQQRDPLNPGDRVEIVGFPGNQGRRFALREAVYRRVSAGKEPNPARLPTIHAMNVDMEGLLAQAGGTLLNLARKDGEARMLIQRNDSVFEAELNFPSSAAAKEWKEPEIGSRLNVVGVYEIQSDEYGQPRSFNLHLRSPADVRILQQPPWWTLSRMLLALMAVGGVSIFSVLWGAMISRKNQFLQQAQCELQMANDRLEIRVEERTRELKEQLVAKERARAALVQAQKQAMLASRQAGMAEVATGVLHNVGNVLNSVNVSAALLNERVRQFRVESVGKAAALLHQHHDDLGTFLSQDPKGRNFPEYLGKLGRFLEREKQDMRDEIEALAKNIEHIKTIVAMQQSYAKIGGVLEELDPKDVLEDAVQINGSALERDHVEVVRDYEPVPRLLVDRHKILQILVNLISNARHALDQKESDKRIKLKICADGPDRVRLSVTDNGIGIPAENLNRIFSQGFTTRKDGHGFGLHSGANAARELGGSLSVRSDGPGRGACFTLELKVAHGAKHEADAK